MAIPTSLIDLYNQKIDEVFQFAKISVTLNYPTITIPCECSFSSIGNFPHHHGIHGGNIPQFAEGCQYCGGTGTKKSQATESLDLCVYFTPKEFVKLPINIDLVDGVIQIKGYLTQLPKLLQCESITISNEIRGIISYTYKRYGEMVPMGFKSNRYIVGYWKKS